MTKRDINRPDVITFSWNNHAFKVAFLEVIGTNIFHFSLSRQKTVVC